MEDFLANRYQRVVDKLLNGLQLKQEFHKVQSMVLYFFKSTLMIYQMNYHQILGLLQMTLLYFRFFGIRICQLRGTSLFQFATLSSHKTVRTLTHAPLLTGLPWRVSKILNKVFLFYLISIQTTIQQLYRIKVRVSELN